MEQENKAESMRRWRKEQKEKKNAIKKAHYEKNRKKLIQKAVERKQQKGQTAVASSTRARSQKITEGGNGKSTARVRKFRQNKAEKKEKEKAQSRERSKKYRAKKKAAEMIIETEETLPVETVGVFKSRMAKKRAVDKTRKALPATPSKKVEVVEKLVLSPQTRKSLEKKGLVKSPEEEKEMEALRAITSDLTSGIKHLKRNKKNEGRAAFGAIKSLAFGETVKEKRLTSTVSKLVSLDRRSVSQGIKRRFEVLKGDEPSWLLTKRKPRVDSLSEEVKNSVCLYWTFEASRPTGDKKDIIRKRIGPKQYIEHPKHVLEQTQSEVYFNFRAANPDVKISQRKFEGLKPYFVKGAKERDRRSCLCRKHEEARIVFSECFKFGKNLLNENPTLEIPLVSLNEAVEMTLCPKPEGSDFHRLCCIDRSCEECGTHLLKLLPEEQSEEGTTKWKRFDYVLTGKVTASGEPQKKIALVQKETCPKELFQYFIQLLEDYPYHQFMAIWQKKQLDELLETLPLGHAVCIHDYSESYSCRGQNEIQSQYFDVNKASLHITVLFRHASARDEKESTAEEPIIIKEHIFVISDDPVQDYDSVHHAQLLVGKYLTDDLQLNITKLHEFTDGCAAQYKSRHCIGDLSCSLADFGFTIQRNFFETSHAKGEQDAAGSHVKQQASLAVVRGTASITNAKDLCDHLTNHFSKPAQSSFPSRSKSVSLNRRIFFYVPSQGPDAILRNREGRKFETVKGIRKLHSVVTTPEQCKVLVRKRSCYCGECLFNNFNDCQNKELVDGLQEIMLQREASAATTRAQSETPLAEPVHLHVADLVGKDSIIAIAADEDDSYDYYLLKVTSEGPVELGEDVTDDYGCAFTAGSSVLKGHFFLRDNLIDMTYKLDEKKVAFVFPGTVRYVCSELIERGRGRKKVYQVAWDVHEDIIASL